MKLTTLCFATVLILSSVCSLQADMIDQIPAGTFTPSNTGPGGQPVALSQYDTGATPPNLPNFATAYDNLQFTTTGFINNVSWVGAYDTAFSGANFTVAFYSSSGGAPATLQQQFLVGNANETATGTPGYFSYSTTETAFNVTAGTEYWMSVVANLDYGVAGWGLAFSNTAVGDDRAIYDSGDQTLNRQVLGSDFAIRVNAVPEPSSLLCLVGLAGAAAFRRRRSV